jgi:small-conductance mechanosensitive channel
MTKFLTVALFLFFAVTSMTSLAVAQNADEAMTATIEVEPDKTKDAKILARAQGVFSQIETLSDVKITVSEGVITLGGVVANEADATEARLIARRIEGAVTVRDDIERTLDVSDNIAPMMAQIQGFGHQAVRAAPLIVIALVLFVIIAWFGHLIANWKSFWQRITPNPFLAELVSQAFRLIVFIVALVTALNLIGASSLTGAILGSAGILGIAIGFAVRDTLENYISSVMLSLRQPFRANEHVVIGDQEGVVVRLTSRATILMTLDGNHLRIPNSNVFKAIILNYTRNPERRFEFELGVDAEDDPLAAISVGIDAMRELDFLLDDPKPFAIIKTVGDSNIVLTFYG